MACDCFFFCLTNRQHSNANGKPSRCTVHTPFMYVSFAKLCVVQHTNHNANSHTLWTSTRRKDTLHTHTVSHTRGRTHTVLHTPTRINSVTWNVATCEVRNCCACHTPESGSADVCATPRGRTQKRAAADVLKYSLYARRRKSSITRRQQALAKNGYPQMLSTKIARKTHTRS